MNGHVFEGRRWPRAIALLLALGGACTGPASPARTPAPPAPLAAPPVESFTGRAPITPILPPSEADRPRIALGRRLFFERQLSHDNSLSCAGCHPLDGGGMDSLGKACGIGGRVGDRNTPTVFNAALNFRQFWDGRADSLESQIDGPIANPNELGSTWSEVIGKLRGDREYVDAFCALYPAGITPESVRDAIATFERTLIRSGSRFDLFLTGHADALTAEERHGYELFQELGCVSCHQGANVGGNMFERLGIVRDYFWTEARVPKSDVGRMAVTGRPVDRFVFRVPSLRLAASTAPYLHDGSIATLRETVMIMARYQVGRELSDADAHAIELFLGTLAGSAGEAARAPLL